MINEIIQTYIVNLKNFWFAYLVLVFITWLIVRLLNWISKCVAKLFCKKDSVATISQQETSSKSPEVSQQVPQVPAEKYLDLTGGKK